MKKLISYPKLQRRIVLFISVFTSVISFAQTADKWENVYGQGGIEYGYRVRSCMDQGYIVAGSTSSNGISDGYIVRVDSLGLLMWSKTYGGNNVDVIRTLRLLPDSGYILAGYSNSAGHGGYDGWVLRTDKYGDTAWTKYIGTTDWDFFYDVTPTWDGGFILAGGTYGQGAGDEDMYFVKIDGNGDTLWTKTYGGIKADEARSIVQTVDSLVAAVGFTYSLGDTLGDSWVLRMDVNGDTLWTRTLGIPGADKAWGVGDMNPLGKILVVGEFTTNGDMNSYIKAIRYDSTFDFMITNGIGGYEYFSEIAVRQNGTFAALGSTENDGGGNGDFFMFNTRTAWTSTSYGTTATEAGYSIDITHDDGYIMCGYTTGFSSVQPNIFLVKSDTNGASTGVLGIRPAPAPLSMGAVSIFPTPADNDVTITFDAVDPFESKPVMQVFDVAGRIVMTIPSSDWQITSARSTTLSLNTSMLNDGIYHFIITNDGEGKCAGKFIVSH
jgi:hypothetical protein